VAKVDPIPENISLPELAEQVVRGKIKLSRDQMRMLIELLPSHMGKVPATHRKDSDLATQLDKRLERAVKRSDKARIYQIEDMQGRDPRE
jgi:hypothetical protein